MRTSLSLSSLAFTFLLGTGCAMEPEAEVGDDTSESNLVGGFPASDPALNAVGTVGFVNPSGEYRYFCTATLISPTVVLTARHCAEVDAEEYEGKLVGMKLVNTKRVYFAVGADWKKPIKVVEAIATDISPVRTGGTGEMGNDVAVYHLAEPITDVAPIAVAAEPFKKEDLGKRFISVGYGGRDSFQDTFKMGLSDRRAGYATLRALEGSPLQMQYPKFEDFVEDMVALIGPALRTELPALRVLWEWRLLDGYQAWLGLGSTGTAADGTSDSQACRGDSGGPLLTAGARRVIMGVASTVGRTQDLTCDRGTTYATFGPRTQEMLTKALAYTDPCGKVTTAGSCDGTVALRCTDKFEGDRRLARMDCADLGMVCRPGSAGKVACVGKDEPVAPAEPTAPTSPTAPTTPAAPMN